MESSEVFERLETRFPGRGIEFHSQEEVGGDPYIQVPGECLVEVCEFLKHDATLDFKMLHCVSAVDYDEVFASVIHLYSFSHPGKLAIRTDCPREDPRIPSLAEVWKGANWHERESFDLMGIVYEGHPDLKRILLSDDWEGHPLRKDYQLPDDTLFPWEEESDAPAAPPQAAAPPLGRPAPSAPTAPKDPGDDQAN